MSDQWKNRIVIVTTGILLFSFSIACLLKPSDEVSLSERRPLTQFPSPDTGSLLSGSFMEKFDKYAVDQFPMREAFRHLYSTVSRIGPVSKDRPYPSVRSIRRNNT